MAIPHFRYRDFLRRRLLSAQPYAGFELVPAGVEQVGAGQWLAATQLQPLQTQGALATGGYDARLAAVQNFTGRAGPGAGLCPPDLEGLSGQQGPRGGNRVEGKDLTMQAEGIGVPIQQRVRPVDFVGVGGAFRLPLRPRAGKLPGRPAPGAARPDQAPSTVPEVHRPWCFRQWFAPRSPTPGRYPDRFPSA